MKIIFHDVYDAFERWCIMAEAIGDVPSWIRVRFMCDEKTADGLKNKLQSLGVRIFI